MGIGIKDYRLLCSKGSAKYNEDIIGITPFGAWVLDGATGLNNKNLVSHESDAKWYVNWWNKYLYENISSNKSLINIIEEGIDEIREEYIKTIGNIRVEKLDLPSCSSSIIKFHNNKIEYFLLGDCTIFINNKGKVNFIKDERVCGFDDMVLESMGNIVDIHKLSFEEKKNKVMNVIINNRLKKNIQDGYWILEFCKNAVNESLHGFIHVEEDMKIMLASDGFTCACDKYNMCNTEELINMASNKGIEYIYRKIRELEKDDENGVRYPRFKISDDSSCILLDIYRNK